LCYIIAASSAPLAEIPDSVIKSVTSDMADPEWCLTTDPEENEEIRNEFLFDHVSYIHVESQLPFFITS